MGKQREFHKFSSKPLKEGENPDPQPNLLSSHIGF
jgi:hypothetical protein